MTSPNIPEALIAISRATVALHIATQCLTPTKSAMRCSNFFTYGPLLVSQRLSRISPTRSSNLSRLPMFGRPTCRASENARGPPKAANSLTSVFPGFEFRWTVVDILSGPGWITGGGQIHGPEVHISFGYTRRLAFETPRFPRRHI